MNHQDIMDIVNDGLNHFADSLGSYDEDEHPQTDIGLTDDDVNMARAIALNMHNMLRLTLDESSQLLVAGMLLHMVGGDLGDGETTAGSLDNQETTALMGLVLGRELAENPLTDIGHDDDPQLSEEDEEDPDENDERDGVDPRGLEEDPEDLEVDETAAAEMRERAAAMRMPPVHDQEERHATAADHPDLSHQELVRGVAKSDPVADDLVQRLSSPVLTEAQIAAHREQVQHHAGATPEEMETEARVRRTQPSVEDVPSHHGE